MGKCSRQAIFECYLPKGQAGIQVFLSPAWPLGVAKESEDHNLLFLARGMTGCHYDISCEK